MNKILKLFTLTITCFLFISNYSIAADTKQRGEIKGGVAHEAPEWFKESFLEIADDVEEATEEGKHVLLFFQLNGCPYCDRMLEESFETTDMGQYIQEHFDTIALNVQGDRDIEFNEDLSVTEKELSEIMKVRATPTIVFLDKDNKSIVRVNGYRSSKRFKKILEYVSSKSYQSSKLSEYLNTHLDQNTYKLRANPLFTELADLSSVKSPLMLIFEDGSCHDCNEFHDGVLGHDLVKKELSPYTIVRLDANSNELITDVDGKKTTPKEMAKKYQMLYRPGVLAFDNSQLVRRHDSLIFPHHFKESMRFVAGGYYKNQDYRTYSQARTEYLLSQGIDINLGRP